jgi:hypothetical protein
MTNVFINYRTGDTDKAAALTDSSLRQEFPHHQVFRDHRSMSPGVDFPSEIMRALRKSDVLLALIGTQWLTLKDSVTDRPRIEAPGDWVRTEIALALEWNLTVIPVLVDGARLPTPGELPDEIKALAQRQRAFLRVSHEHLDMPVLIKAIRGTAQGAVTPREEDAPSDARFNTKIKKVERTAFSINGNAQYSEAPNPKDRP